jgi:dCTP diphosphatase
MGADTAMTATTEKGKNQPSKAEEGVANQAPQASETTTVPGRQRTWNEVNSLQKLRKDIGNFARERDWEQFQTPRNLLLALVGEVGEVSEIFQWKGEVDNELSSFTSQEKENLGDELSDVLFYLLRLSDVCGIDLGEAACKKLLKNIAKYPVSKCYGKSTKYNLL